MKSTLALLLVTFLKACGPTRSGCWSPCSHYSKLGFLHYRLLPPSTTVQGVEPTARVVWIRISLDLPSTLNCLLSVPVVRARFRGIPVRVIRLCFVSCSRLPLLNSVGLSVAAGSTALVHPCLLIISATLRTETVPASEFYARKHWVGPLAGQVFPRLRWSPFPVANRA